MAQSTPAKGTLEPLAVSIPEAGRLLAISERQAWHLVKLGVIPTSRVGQRRVVPVEALRRMLADNAVHIGEVSA